MFVSSQFSRVYFDGPLTAVCRMDARRPHVSHESWILMVDIIPLLLKKCPVVVADRRRGRRGCGTRLSSKHTPLCGPETDTHSHFLLWCPFMIWSWSLVYTCSYFVLAFLHECTLFLSNLFGSELENNVFGWKQHPTPCERLCFCFF